MEKSYTVGELAALSGVSARTLRFYEETGLLVPQRDLHNGYRRYGAADIDRLQEILLLRRLGVAVRDIAPLLSTTNAERQNALDHHLAGLREERARLDALITTVEHTLAEMRGDATMSDAEKFEGLKRKTVEDNERRYGAEARERYGDRAVDESNRKMLNMSEKDYAAWQELEVKIREMLEEVVCTPADPAALRASASAIFIAVGLATLGLLTRRRPIEGLPRPMLRTNALRPTMTATFLAVLPGCAMPFLFTLNSCFFEAMRSKPLHGCANTR